MPRAKNKDELMKDAVLEYNKLINLLNELGDKNATSNFTFSIEGRKEAHWERDKNIKDVLIHLHEWHNLLLNWINENKKGNKKQFLEEPYNWKTYGEMNKVFVLRHQNTSYDDALAMFTKSHDDVMTLLTSLTNDELFSKGVFDWVGGTNLGSYFISTTTSHYNWAFKKIKLHKDTINK